MQTFNTPSDLLETVNAFRLSRIILTAWELRIFDQINTGLLSSKEIAERLGTDPRATDRFLNALCATGLVVKSGGKFSNTQFTGRYLVSTSPEYMRALGHNSALWRTWSTLTEVVRTGRMSNVHEEQINDRGREWLEPFIATMHARGIPQGREVAAMLDLSKVRRVLDVGGGSGAFVFGMIELNPAIRGVVLDLPNVVPITQKYIDQEGYHDRVETLTGDYHNDDFGRGYDLVLMSAIIHINNHEENRELIKKGAAALEPGGQLVILDHVMNEERTEPAIGAMFAINMLVGTPHGDTFTENEISAWMRETGLEKIRLMEGKSGVQVMVGYRLRVEG